jgi:hypothetical protein
VRRLRAYARVVPDPIGPDIGDGVAERIDAAAAGRRAALAVADLPAEQREVLLLSCVGFGWYERRAIGQRKGERCWVRLVGKGERGVLLGTEVAWWGAYAQVGGCEEGERSAGGQNDLRNVRPVRGCGRALNFRLLEHLLSRS